MRIILPDNTLKSHTHMHIYIHIYIYICVCVCVCVCVYKMSVLREESFSFFSDTSQHVFCGKNEASGHAKIWSLFESSIDGDL